MADNPGVECPSCSAESTELWRESLLPFRASQCRQTVRGYELHSLIHAVVDRNSNLLSLPLPHQDLQPGQGLAVVEIGLKHLCLYFGFLCRYDLGTVFFVTRSLYLNC